MSEMNLQKLGSKMPTYELTEDAKSLLSACDEVIRLRYETVQLRSELEALRKENDEIRMLNIEVTRTNSRFCVELEAERGKYKELAKSVVKLHDNHPNAFAELIERLEVELRRTE